MYISVEQFDVYQMKRQEKTTELYSTMTLTRGLQGCKNLNLIKGMTEEFRQQGRNCQGQLLDTHYMTLNQMKKLQN
jgi:hypothetical protein